MGVDAHVANRLMGMVRHDALVIGRYVCCVLFTHVANRLLVCPFFLVSTR
jgi:hypothetical protein